ncbi:MAG TPA: Spy/CpxP family protein refolding chaperone [Azospirillum sp.]|nr:Spy/CpxP family protein refolding chaperone [Azospirillum sp.]
MSTFTRAMLPAFTLAAMMSAAQAQTTDQDHDAHHPDGAAAPVQPAPVPTPSPLPAGPGSGASGNAPMIGQGMGSGAIVQPGTQQPMGQPGMMMGGMMGQQDGQSGMMGAMMPMMRQMMAGSTMMGPMMMGPMMMGQPGMAMGGMGMPFEHVEGRIAFLKTELRITDAQKQPWEAFADALRANAKAQQAVHEQMGKGGMPASWPDRLALQQKALSARLDALKTLEAAAKPLYAVLTDEQRKAADRLLAGPMGMMLGGMM